MKDWLATTYPNAVALSKRQLRKETLLAMEEQTRQAEGWARLWFSPETQGALTAFKANLAKKSKL